MATIVQDTKTLRTYSKEWKGSDEELKDLLSRMKLAMVENEGQGIAAIQIGEPYRVFVAVTMWDDVFVNPVVKNRSSIMKTDWEGCLSCKDAAVRVKRSHSIDLEYTNFKGNRKTTKFTGNDARVIQHELDHLNGFLITDRGKVYRP